MMRLVEIRVIDGRQRMALQGQTDDEAREMGRQFILNRDRIAAGVFYRAFQSLPLPTPLL